MLRTACALSLLALSACSSNDEVAQPRQPSSDAGGGMDAGGQGGSSGVAGSSGFAGSGGSAGSPPQPDCSPYCANLASSGCTGAPSESACVTFCDAVVQSMSSAGCGTEYGQVLDCYGQQPSSAFTCDSAGSPTLPVTSCQTSVNALDACLCSSACTAIVAAGCPMPSQDECLTACDAFRDACPACRNEYSGLLLCQSAQPPSGFVCNAEGGTELATGNCADNVTSWQACLNAKCP